MDSVVFNRLRKANLAISWRAGYAGTAYYRTGLYIIYQRMDTGHARDIQSCLVHIRLGASCAIYKTNLNTCTEL